MKKVELIERVQKKIDELGTRFDQEVNAPNGDLLGKISLVKTYPGNGVMISFGGWHRTIGTNSRNPEKAVEEFFNNPTWFRR